MQAQCASVPCQPLQPKFAPSETGCGWEFTASKPEYRLAFLLEKVSEGLASCSHAWAWITQILNWPCTSFWDLAINVFTKFWGTETPSWLGIRSHLRTSNRDYLSYVGTQRSWGHNVSARWWRKQVFIAGQTFGCLACLSNLQELDIGHFWEYGYLKNKEPPAFALDLQTVYQLQPLTSLTSLASCLS